MVSPLPMLLVIAGLNSFAVTLFVPHSSGIAGGVRGKRKKRILGILLNFSADRECCQPFSGNRQKKNTEYISRRCACCGHITKADVNDARNILAAGLVVLACGGMAQSGRSLKQEPSSFGARRMSKEVVFCQGQFGYRKLLYVKATF